jgi:hypothetical protein
MAKQCRPVKDSIRLAGTSSSPALRSKNKYPRNQHEACSKQLLTVHSPSMGHSSNSVCNPVDCHFTHTSYLVSRHNFFNVSLCYHRRLKPSESLFGSENVTLRNTLDKMI